MSDHWPLLVAEPLDGERLVNSQLRPRAGAIAIGRHDFSAARQEVVELCGTWGGGGMPLIPVTVGETVDERWSRILNEGNIDGIERTDLLSDEEVRKYTDLHGPDTAQLIRIVVDLERKPTVQTCQGLSEDDPWHLAYLAVLGDLSLHPHRQNTWNDLRPDLTFQAAAGVGLREKGDAATCFGGCRAVSPRGALHCSLTNVNYEAVHRESAH
jgi:hypothetical protein